MPHLFGNLQGGRTREKQGSGATLGGVWRTGAGPPWGSVRGLNCSHKEDCSLSPSFTHTLWQHIHNHTVICTNTQTHLQTHTLLTYILNTMHQHMHTSLPVNTDQYLHPHDNCGQVRTHSYRHVHHIHLMTETQTCTCTHIKAHVHIQSPTTTMY